MQRGGESKQPVEARRANKRKAAKASPARVLTTDTQQVAALKHELEKAREQQTATSELLRIISNSPTELQIGFGIGVAHGFATLGTIGFEGRFDYATVLIASRPSRGRRMPTPTAPP